MDDWFEKILELFKNGIIRTQKNKLYQIWNLWIEFITPIRADCI